MRISAEYMRTLTIELDACDDITSFSLSTGKRILGTLNSVERGFLRDITFGSEVNTLTSKIRELSEKPLVDLSMSPSYELLSRVHQDLSWCLNINPENPASVSEMPDISDKIDFLTVAINYGAADFEEEELKQIAGAGSSVSNASALLKAKKGTKGKATLNLKDSVASLGNALIRIQKAASNLGPREKAVLVKLIKGEKSQDNMNAILSLDNENFHFFLSENISGVPSRETDMKFPGVEDITVEAAAKAVLDIAPIEDLNMQAIESYYDSLNLANSLTTKARNALEDLETPEDRFSTVSIF